MYVIAAPDALLPAEIVPHAAPVQPAPESAQATPLFEVSFITVAMKFACCPTCTDAVEGETETTIGVGGGAEVWAFKTPRGLKEVSYTRKSLAEVSYRPTYSTDRPAMVPVTWKVAPTTVPLRVNGAPLSVPVTFRFKLLWLFFRVPPLGGE